MFKGTVGVISSDPPTIKYLKTTLIPVKRGVRCVQCEISNQLMLSLSPLTLPNILHRKWVSKNLKENIYFQPILEREY